MSRSTTDLENKARDVWAEAQDILAKGEARDVPDALVQNLFAAALRLFAQKVDEERRYFSPLPDNSGATATDVAVGATELMRAVDLNLFDLSMWASRPRDEEVIDRSGRWS
jgi:hypothetical protein